MAIRVPEYVDAFHLPKHQGEQVVGNALCDQLSDEYTVFYSVKASNNREVDFVVLTPDGLVFIEVKGGVVDVHCPPHGNVQWTYRRRDGKEVDPVEPAKLWDAKRQISKDLSLTLGCHDQKKTHPFGGGELFIFPHTTAAHLDGSVLTAPDRITLIDSDMMNLRCWIDAAAMRYAANPALTPERRAALIETLTAKAHKSRPEPIPMQPETVITSQQVDEEPPNTPPVECPQKQPRRQFTTATKTGALFIGAMVVLALISDRIPSVSLSSGKPGVTSPVTSPAHQPQPKGPISHQTPTPNPRTETQHGNPSLKVPLPSFVVPGAKWAVTSAMDAAGQSINQPVLWIYDEGRGFVTMTSRQQNGCRNFRVTREDTRPAKSQTIQACN